LARAGLATAVASAPAAVVGLTGLLARPGAEGLFVADAAGVATAVGVAAFAPAGAARSAARIAVAAALGGLAHAGVAALRGGAASGAWALAALVAGVMAGAAGLASLARGGGVPAPAGPAVAAAVLWTACGGAWWADALAGNVAGDDRTSIRQAVLDLDPFTAAAYGCARFDRLHATDLYDSTVVATLPLTPPAPLETGAWWTGAGLVAAAGGLAASRLRRPASERAA
jgi:hypothetical protein